MDANPQPIETTDTQAVGQSENISPTGIASMQGGETGMIAQDAPAAQTDAPQFATDQTKQDPPETPPTPPPGDQTTSGKSPEKPATYDEAKEGDRNQEDLVETNYELHPPTGKEHEPGGLKWQPHGGGERGG